LLGVLVGCKAVEIGSSQTTRNTVGATALTPRASGATELLVIAPHPDDESLGCGGVIQQALAAGQSVHVVLLTDGDGYPAAASALSGKPVHSLAPSDFLELARVRQNEALAAVHLLGLAPANLIFLGYPNPGLRKIYQAGDGAPYQQPFTQKRETYGIARPDYHTEIHGKPAAYRKESIQADLTEIIKRFKPSKIYVPSEADKHADHQAAIWFVRDAVKAARYMGPVDTYLIHAKPNGKWPWPRGITPKSKFEAPLWVYLNLRWAGLSWPPPIRVRLTQAETAQKLKAIRSYQSQMRLAGEGPYLESFVKGEEIFWPDARRAGYGHRFY
jgi:LmbE family N-acetylglucosaminyl deacetylase